MIPVIVFVALIAVMIPLFIYSFLDTRNRFYGNIIAAFLVALIAGYLAVVISIGIVQYDPVTTVNGTWGWSNTSTFDTRQNETVWTNITVYNAACETCPGVKVIDASFGYIMLLISVVMMIYTFIMIYEAWDERRMSREEE